MKQVENRILAVNDCFTNGDHHLGMRRLIDCVMDTGHLPLFKEALDMINQTPVDGSKPLSNEQIASILEAVAKHQVKINTGADQVLMEVKGIEKTYKKSHFKISPVNFQLHYGEVVGLVGENGNGKTTLLRLLCKDLNPDGGSIQYSKNIHNDSLFELRSKLIYIPQRVPRWFGSLMDNLYFTQSNYGIRNEENVLRAELMIARLGLRPYKNLGWNRISSGYRTRFELARSLLRRPALMLLDEPLSNLDIISQQTILQDLKAMSESLSNPFGIVLSSQQLYEVEKISDLVVFLKNGVPQYQSKRITEDDNNGDLIFEIDGNFSRDLLQEVFSDKGLNSIQFNGGVYLLHFNPGVKTNDIYTCIGKHDLPVNYIRNISHSSRRFFIN